MEQGVLLGVVGAVVPLALDYYVFRNWRRFAGSRRYRRRLGWTLPVYRVLMAVMPFVMPLYFAVSRWWEVEPKLARSLVIGLWITYYLPKALVALVLLVKDGLRAVSWLFGWFQDHLLGSDDGPADGPAEDPPAAPALDLADIKRTSRRTFLREIGWSAASVPFVLVGYSVFRTLYDFEVHRVDVPVAGLPRALDGLTIAQLSDLHAGSFFSERPMQEAVDLVHDLRPDLVALTGDFVNHDAAELALILPALERLRADLGVYGCLGNHDHYARIGDVVAGVRGSGVDLLVNEGRTFRIDGARLHLAGTDNTGFYQHFADLPRALADLDVREAAPGADEIRILLAHTPTFWDSHVRPQHPEIDLMLCGHTHGGQVGFELGPLRYSLARVAYPRWAGLYREPRADGEGAQALYVNRGVGTVGPPLRLGIRPEITLLTLRRAA
ncbi:MAG: metallophosphoesterase [Rhodothermales bacterium]|nr:metallophosphoesterase [Rhodothermales bacterium]